MLRAASSISRSLGTGSYALLIYGISDKCSAHRTVFLRRRWRIRCWTLHRFLCLEYYFDSFVVIFVFITNRNAYLEADVCTFWYKCDLIFHYRSRSTTHFVGVCSYDLCDQILSTFPCTLYQSVTGLL